MNVQNYTLQIPVTHYVACAAVVVKIRQSWGLKFHSGTTFWFLSC